MGEKIAYKKRRRDILTRTKTDGQIPEITENVRKRIFNPLARYRAIPSSHFEALYGARYVFELLEPYFNELSDLPANRQLINRPREINRNVGTTLFTELGPAGYEYVDYPRHLIDHTRIGPRRDSHDLHVCMSVQSIEAALKDRFVNHLEILEKAPAEQRDQETPISFASKNGLIRPDALFGVRNGEKFKFYALELDRHNESGKYIQEKLNDYTYALDNQTYKTLGIPNLRVLWLTYSQKREDNIKKRVDRFHEGHLFKQTPRYSLFEKPHVHLDLGTGTWTTAKGHKVTL